METRRSKRVIKVNSRFTNNHKHTPSPSKDDVNRHGEDLELKSAEQMKTHFLVGATDNVEVPQQLVQTEDAKKVSRGEAELKSKNNEKRVNRQGKVIEFKSAEQFKTPFVVGAAADNVEVPHNFVQTKNAKKFSRGKPELKSKSLERAQSRLGDAAVVKKHTSSSKDEKNVNRQGRDVELKSADQSTTHFVVGAVDDVEMPQQLVRTEDARNVSRGKTKLKTKSSKLTQPRLSDAAAAKKLGLRNLTGNRGRRCNKHELLKYCTEIKEKNTINVADLKRYLLTHIKIDGKLNNLGTNITLLQLDWTILIKCKIKFNKSSLRYLVKKYLKREKLRGLVYVVAKEELSFQLKYYRFEENEGSDNL